MGFDSLFEARRRTVLSIVGLGVLLLALITYIQINKYLDAGLNQKEAEMSVLSLLIDRNAPTEKVSRIIRDCNERDRFDTLLGNLGNLKPTELNEAVSLFDACAGYTARVKQMSVFEFENTFAVYNELYKVEKMLRFYTGDRARVHSAWRELVELEDERSNYYEEQVSLQKEIMLALQSGEKNNSPAVTERVRKAEILGQNLGQVDATIDALRATIVSKD